MGNFNCCAHIHLFALFSACIAFTGSSLGASNPSDAQLLSPTNIIKQNKVKRGVHFQECDDQQLRTTVENMIVRTAAGTWRCSHCEKELKHVHGYVSRRGHVVGCDKMLKKRFSGSYKCLFSGCGHRLYHLSSMHAHVQAAHVSSRYRRYMCSACLRKRALKTSIKRHIHACHGDDAHIIDLGVGSVRQRAALAAVAHRQEKAKPKKIRKSNTTVSLDTSSNAGSSISCLPQLTQGVCSGSSHATSPASRPAVSSYTGHNPLQRTMSHWEALTAVMSDQLSNNGTTFSYQSPDALLPLSTSAGLGVLSSLFDGNSTTLPELPMVPVATWGGQDGTFGCWE